MEEKMKNQYSLFTLLLSFCLFRSVLAFGVEIPQNVIGMWQQEQTGRLTYGFFEQFAVVEGAFWTYETMVPRKGGVEVSLKDAAGRKRLNLKLQAMSDTVLSITSEADGTQLFVSNATPSTSQVPKETRDFISNGYQRDTVTIVGYLRHLKGKKTFEISYYNFFDDSFGAKCCAELDSLGRFRIQIPILNTTEIYLDGQRTNVKTVVEPGEELFLYADHEKGSFDKYVAREVRFMGKNALFHTEMAHFLLPLNLNLPYASDLKGSQEEYLKICQAKTTAREAYLDSVVASRPWLPARFIDFQKKSLTYDLLSHVTQRLDQTSLKIVEEAVQNLPPSVFTFREIGTFMNAYLRYKKVEPQAASTAPEDEANKQINEMARLKALLMDQHVAQSYWDIAFAKYYTDQTRLDHKEMPPKAYDYLLSQLRSPAFKEVLQEKNDYYKSLVTMALDNPASLKNSEPFKDFKEAEALFHALLDPYKGSVVYLDFWGTWCGPCVMALKKMPAFIERFKGKNVVFLFLANNSPQKRWENLIKEYKLTGKNIVHYNLPRVQQTLLEQRMHLSSFPSTFLLDTSGTVVRSQLISPDDVDQFATEIKTSAE